DVTVSLGGRAKDAAFVSHIVVGVVATKATAGESSSGRTAKNRMFSGHMACASRLRFACERAIGWIYRNAFARRSHASGLDRKDSDDELDR
ncbi:MAG TPA: hypothetical protein VGI70_10115, partial [Polyangiales bacterium]